MEIARLSECSTSSTKPRCASNSICEIKSESPLSKWNTELWWWLPDVTWTSVWTTWTHPREEVWLRAPAAVRGLHGGGGGEGGGWGGRRGEGGGVAGRGWQAEVHGWRAEAGPVSLMRGRPGIWSGEWRLKKNDVTFVKLKRKLVHIWIFNEPYVSPRTLSQFGLTWRNEVKKGHEN